MSLPSVQELLASLKKQEGHRIIRHYPIHNQSINFGTHLGPRKQPHHLQMLDDRDRFPMPFSASPFNPNPSHISRTFANPNTQIQASCNPYAGEIASSASDQRHQSQTLDKPDICFKVPSKQFQKRQLPSYINNSNNHHIFPMFDKPISGIPVYSNPLQKRNNLLLSDGIPHAAGKDPESVSQFSSYSFKRQRRKVIRIP